MRHALAIGVLGIFVSASAVWVGCGGDDSTAASGSDGGVDGSASGDDGAAVGSDGSPGSGSDAAGGGGGGGGGDGGRSADGGPGGSTGAVACGTTTCTVPAESCCVSDTGGGNFAFACSGTGDGGVCPRNDVALKCEATANCSSGQVCCMRDDGNGHVTSTCQATCSGGGGGASAQLCDKAAGDAGCLNQQPCSSDNISDWNLPAGFATCGGKGN